MVESGPVHVAGQPGVCVGVRIDDATGEVVENCPNEATQEILRTCHGISKVSLVCDRHARIATKRLGRCKQCGGRAVRFVLGIPLGGAA